MRRPFPEPWEEIVERRLTFVKELPADEAQRFFVHLKVFVWEKHWVGAGGLEVTDEMKVVIAGAAARMGRNLPLNVFDRLGEVVIYPGGYVHPDDERPGMLDGEAHHFGTVVLSWDGVTEGLERALDGFNPALHEFAHVLDVASGYYDGTPVLHSGHDYESWEAVFTRHFEALCEHPEESYMDSYGCEDEAEFFAVATETFFEMPDVMRERAPDLYAELARFYRLDPVVVALTPEELEELERWEAEQAEQGDEE